MSQLRERDNSVKAYRVRRNETTDLVERLLFLKADQVELSNYPLSPYKIFNATHVVEKDKIVVYVRGVFDYYRYVSSIIRVELDLNDVLNRRKVDEKIRGETIIIPDRIEDFWGAEDPRYIGFGNEKFLAYTGRTKWYYENDDDPKYRTVTVIAKMINGEWIKIGYLTPPKRIMGETKSLKNCLLVRGRNYDYAPCRIHTWDKRFITVIGRLRSRLNHKDYSPIELRDLEIVLNPASFEEKTGWGTPFIHIDKNSYIAILHGVDRETLIYRAFAAEFKEGKDGLELVAVTPRYILEPRVIEEKYGDRPYVVFPCGLQKVDDYVTITYGAADTFVGVGKIKLDELLNELDKGRID